MSETVDLKLSFYGRAHKECREKGPGHKRCDCALCDSPPCPDCLNALHAEEMADLGNKWCAQVLVAKNTIDDLRRQLEEKEEHNPCRDALDILWKEIMPEGYGDWEYPGFAARHIIAEIADREEKLRAQLSAAQKEAKFNKKMLDSMERQRPLCPDHRDKQAGKRCLVCTAEAAQGDVGKVSNVAMITAQRLDTYFENLAESDEAGMLDQFFYSGGCEERMKAAIDAARGGEG